MTLKYLFIQNISSTVILYLQIIDVKFSLPIFVCLLLQYVPLTKHFQSLCVYNPQPLLLHTNLKEEPLERTRVF